MSEKIFIVAAAIKDTNGGVHYMSPPARHYNIIWWMKGRYNQLTGMPDIFFDDGEQGFITNEMKFVDRREAMKITMAAGQYDNPDNDDELFSEDLW
jgi:hypothetical protein